ncbi:PepSY domain-containing protein [Thalassotalea euphylliae]|uniref:PepSY domain-containing protein n=1 Tax=Thalassotalea euphylliae TaxID=1655234 RepID=UPI003630D91C
MKIQSTAATLHKWLMAAVGIQLLIWSITGLYMVAMDIHYIHGDTLVKNNHTYVDTTSVKLDLSAILKRYPKAQKIRLSNLNHIPVYRFHSEDKHVIVDARNGKVLSPISEQLAIELAVAEFTGSAEVISAQLITEQPPYELSARHLPVWQVAFADDIGSILYVGVNNGEVVTKRHQYWRLFDWMFRFHIMDYQDSDIANNLLRVVAFITLLASLAGALLVYMRVVKPSLQRRAMVGGAK